MNQSTKTSALCSAEHINMCSGNESRLCQPTSSEIQQNKGFGGQAGIRNKALKILKAGVLKTENKKEPGTVFLIHSTSSSTLSRFGKLTALSLSKGSLPKGSVLIPSKVEGLADKKLAVACGENALILEDIQLEGKKPMSASDFLNGHPEIINSVLS